MFAKKLLWLPLLMICSLTLWAQTSVTISGNVVDDYGLPIEGAYLLVNGSGNGVVTDENGNFQYSFSISNPEEAFVEVSAFGFETKNIVIGKQRVFNIVLLEEAITLDEIVVTSSYGTKKLKEEVVGSIVSIDQEDIQVAQSFESIDKMIDGLVPGLQINAGSEIGTPVQMNIRGVGSLQAINNNQIGTSTMPLIIIDGIIMSEDIRFDNRFFDGGATSETILNNLARIDPNNVENISFLKDAAAVAIYGADAANGVIIITTKKGKKGRTKFNFGTQYGVSTGINKIKYLNGEQYATLRNTYLSNSGRETVEYNGVDVNWFEELNKVGTQFRTNFGASGGLGSMVYNASISYQKINEAQIGNEYDRINGNVSLGYTADKFSFNFSGSANRVEKIAPNTFYNFILAPDFAIYDENGNFSETGIFGIPNPLAAINQNINDSKTNSYLTSINTTYSPFEGLELRGIFGVDYSDREQVVWLSGLNYSGRRQGTFLAEDGNNYARRGISRRFESESFKWNSSISAYYEKSINETHNFDALAGLELRKDNVDKVRHSGQNFIEFERYRLPWETDEIDDDGNSTYNRNTLTSEQTGRSIFAQFNYNYKKKYFLSVSGRRDESSAFGNDRNAAINGGLGASWVISKEDWMNSETISFLRLRTSWGMTGNSRIGSFRSSGLYAVDPDDNDGYNGGVYGTPIPNAPRNNELGWEKNEKYNLGIDLEVLNNWYFTLDLFRNNISDVIVSREVPLETGYSSVQINGAEMYNQGFEFSVRGKVIGKENFRWDTNFNISKVENKVTDLSGIGAADSNSNTARAQRIGVPTTAFWGWDWVGVDPATGRDLYNVQGQIVTSQQLNDNFDISNQSIIGNSQPDFNGGFINNLHFFKRFHLSFAFTFEWGSDILVQNELIDQYRTLENRNMSVNVLNHWMQVGDVANYPIPIDNNAVIPNSSKYIYDLSHIRLRNINFSYSLPVKEMNAGFLDSAQIFVDATNVWYWYRSKSPEGLNGVREYRFQYPEMFTLSMGFRANF